MFAHIVEFSPVFGFGFFSSFFPGSYLCVCERERERETKFCFSGAVGVVDYVNVE